MCDGEGGGVLEGREGCLRHRAFSRLEGRGGEERRKTGREEGMQGGRQVGGQEDGHAGRQAGGQAGRQAGRQKSGYMSSSCQARGVRRSIGRRKRGESEVRVATHKSPP